MTLIPWQPKTGELAGEADKAYLSLMERNKRLAETNALLQAHLATLSTKLTQMEAGEAAELDRLRRKLTGLMTAVDQYLKDIAPGGTLAAALNEAREGGL